MMAFSDFVVVVASSPIIGFQLMNHLLDSVRLVVNFGSLFDQSSKKVLRTRLLSKNTSGWSSHCVKRVRDELAGGSQDFVVDVNGGMVKDVMENAREARHALENFGAMMEKDGSVCAVFRVDGTHVRERMVAFVVGLNDVVVVVIEETAADSWFWWRR